MENLIITCRKPRFLKAGFSAVSCKLFKKTADSQSAEVYTGCTDNLKDRFDRHQKGNIPATKNRLPVKLVSYFAFTNKYTAFNFEKYLKSGSGRAFIKKHKLVE